MPRNNAREGRAIPYRIRRKSFDLSGGNSAKGDGGEGGIRTPDTVARTPHFECGAFNHSATSPEGKNLSDAARYVTAAPSGDKVRYWTRRGPLELPAELAIERKRSTAAQRDSEADQPP